MQSSPFVMIIFGATGDLSRNKLMPALFSLFKQRQMSGQFFIVGFARRPFTDEEFRVMMSESLLSGDETEVRNFFKSIYYQQGLFDQQKGYDELINKLNSFDQKMGACITRLFYLATPPDNYETILNFLHDTKLSEGRKHGSSKWTRLIIEKPFGKDIETARSLDKKLAKVFEEKQIFRVDHYLGKETVQNILTFRFANGIFEPIWNKKYIDHIQLTWAETKGIGGRGKFFDGVGLLRDVGQNHLMQLIAAVAMEQPRSFSREGVRDARAKAIKAIRFIESSEVQKFVVRGQYGGYKEEKDVKKDSGTETFVAMKLFVDNERFRDVPFYIRAGKKMQKDLVEISIVFIQTCHLLFKEFGCPEEGNILRIRIQPDEGIGIRVIAKKPGVNLSLQTVDMEFSYKEEFGEKVSDAYEKILIDIFKGDQMLFNRSDELESSWEFITKILEGWSREARPGFARETQKSEIKVYEAGTWGPKDADELIARDGRKWL
ncbi:MAG: glucose-6-phosphate dehydrogenase [Patescibacteria group bacterium]